MTSQTIRPLKFASVPGLALALAMGLASCGAEVEERPDAVELATRPEAPVIVSTGDAQPAASDAAAAMDADGRVVLTVDRLVSEDAACLLMIDVANGTDAAVTAGLFAFDVTGNGESSGANMFPQTAGPGTVATAQIILPGADCANALAIEGGQINCRVVDTGESCVDITELRDGAIDFTAAD
ncbi:hypothetical protein [uncultured Algimonas sp.]|uniref:hypothetical protein n=1 Tax=uncultured Algimonas sp. TaxID=1547920 RepID=UPI00260AA7DC|nr:hypothetical protein [uncultured Algimonas sp.]